MYTGIFDTHAHYDDARFDDIRDGLLAGLAEKGVSLVLNCASGLKSAETTLALNLYGLAVEAIIVFVLSPVFAL